MQINYAITDAIEQMHSDGIKTSITILDKNGSKIRTLANSTRKLAKNEVDTLENQKNTDIWDGRDGDGNLVDDGEYIFEIHVIDLAGNSKKAAGSIRIPPQNVEDIQFPD